MTNAPLKRVREMLQTIHVGALVLGILIGVLTSAGTAMISLRAERQRVLDAVEWLQVYRPGIEALVRWEASAQEEIQTLKTLTMELKGVVEEVFLKPIGPARVVNFTDQVAVQINVGGPASSLLSVGRSRTERDRFYVKIIYLSPPYPSTDRVLVLGTYTDLETRTIARLSPAAARLLGIPTGDSPTLYNVRIELAPE